MPVLAPPPDLQIYTLGDVQIELRAHPILKLTKPTKALLVYLALHPTRAFSRQELAQLFWLASADEGNPQEEKRANDSVRKAIQILRGALGDDLLIQDPDKHTVRLNPARNVWLDARAIETTARAFLAAPRSSESPLHLLRGEFMAGYDDLPAPAWIEQHRARLIEVENQLHIAEARAAKQRGEYARALAHAERVLQRDATNQDACAEAMWCHWRLNQPREGLRVYEELKRALRERNETAFVPYNALRQLRAKIQNDLERTTRRALQLTNLPLLETSFIGRARELQELRALLHPREGRAKRLVTLIGPGGSGKTRLARELAAGVLKQYRDGVWWIELDALEKDRGDVAQAIAQVLGIRHETERALEDTLAAYLRDKKMLLVLDNCEHVLRASDNVCAKILANCPRVQIVATSREGLRVSGEKQFALAPLDAPKIQDAASLKTLAQFDAVRLFTDRARQENDAFVLNQDNAREVAKVCGRLDGLPLALELAAARLNTLTLREIVDGLDERFELLKRGKRIPARHETLRAVLDWSYDLLNDDERALFARLGVFAGRFTFEAMERVATDDGQPTADDDARSAVRRLSSLLESLVAKSLVQLEFDADGARRYRLLETLRAYAREKLDEDTTLADAAYVRMARYYLEFAKTHEQDFIGLEREWDNLSYGLSIMHWQENWQEVLEYGYALTDAAFARGLYTQARAMYPQVMEATGRLEEQGADIQMRLNYARALIEQGFYPEAREVLEQLLRISEMAGDEYGVAGAQTLLGRVAREQGRFEESETFLEEGLKRWIRLGHRVGQGLALASLANLKFRQKDYGKVSDLAFQAIDVLEGTHQTAVLIELWRLLALCAHDQGDLVIAQQYNERALELCQGEKYRDERALVLYTLSQILWKRGMLVEAKTESQNALNIFEALGEIKLKAYVLNHLVRVYTDLKEYSSALFAARTSQEILERLGDDWSLVYVWRDLGSVYKVMGKLKRARKIWLHALETIETEFPDHRLKEKILELLKEG